MKHGCKGTFKCGVHASAVPFTCGLQTGRNRCECVRGDYCSAPHAPSSPPGEPPSSAAIAAVATRPVPRGYIETVYGPTASQSVVNIGALELLYSAASVPPAVSSAPLSEPAEFVSGLVRGDCYGFTGQGDVSCCPAADDRVFPTPLYSGRFATTQGQLLYNPYYRESDRAPSQRSPAASNSWVEVTRWPSACIHALSTTTNGRGIATPCDGLVNNRTYGVWFYAASGTGVFINVGRTLVFPRGRTQAAQHLCRLFDTPKL